MPKNIKTIVLDSCVIIDEFHKDTAKGLFPILDRHNYQILLPVVQLAEIGVKKAKKPKDYNALKSDQETIDKFLSGQRFEFLSADPEPCRLARALIRSTTLKPMDAIILATAIHTKADLFVTNDPDFAPKKMSHSPLLKQNPNFRIITASEFLKEHADMVDEQLEAVPAIQLTLNHNAVKYDC